MPYIICENRPGNLPEADPFAVVLLEEAQIYAADVVRHRAFPEDKANEQKALDLPAEGGVIGPLSDGYVIDVTLIGWPELAAQVQDRIPDPNPSENAIIDAYNGA